MREDICRRASVLLALSIMRRPRAIAAAPLEPLVAALGSVSQMRQNDNLAQKV